MSMAADRRDGDPGPDAAAGTRHARDRDVILAAAIVVAVVLGLDLLTAAVPALDAILAQAPVVVIVMVGVTALVMARAVGRRRPR